MSEEKVASVGDPGEKLDKILSGLDSVHKRLDTKDDDDRRRDDILTDMAKRMDSLDSMRDDAKRKDQDPAHEHEQAAKLEKLAEEEREEAKGDKKRRSDRRRGGDDDDKRDDDDDDKHRDDDDDDKRDDYQVVKGHSAPKPPRRRSDRRRDDRRRDDDDGDRRDARSDRHRDDRRRDDRHRDDDDDDDHRDDDGYDDRRDSRSDRRRDDRHRDDVMVRDRRHDRRRDDDDDDDRHDARSDRRRDDRRHRDDENGHGGGTDDAPPGEAAEHTSLEPPGKAEPPHSSNDSRRDARADSASPREIQKLKAHVDAISRKISARDYEDQKPFAAIQARADEVYTAYGEQAPPPLLGEATIKYRSRLLRPLQKHSEAWKDEDLTALEPTKRAYDNAENAIYADALAHARNPTDLGPGQLREVIRVDRATGRRMTEWVGDPISWMQAFMTPGRAATRLNNPNQR